MAQADKFTKGITRAYWKELGGAMVFYTVAIFGTMPFVQRFEEFWQRSLIVLLPMIPIFLATIAIYRHLMRMDEFQRQQAYQVLTIAAALTMLVSMGYGFLEIAGLPKLSMFAVWMTMGSFWLIVNFAFRLLGKHHP